MDKVKYLMIIQVICNNHLIIKILIHLNNNGNIMKVDYILMLNKDLGKLNYKMDKYILDIFIMINLMDKVDSIVKMEKLYMEFGKILFWLNSYNDL